MVGIKKPCQMLEPFPNTLEDHAKHKVRELGRIPLFPPSQRLKRRVQRTVGLSGEANVLCLFHPSLRR